MGALLHPEYDLLDYDVIYVCSGGQGGSNVLAQPGYLGDHEPDRKHVCSALVGRLRRNAPGLQDLSTGDRTDVTTVEDIVEKIGRQCGAAEHVWGVHRRTVSGENLESTVIRGW